ncbi:hypothetical protein, partial [Enterobacter cloacae complex sp. 4DZ3-17B2]|uniref:hypothetical protein n=1 Tax=Enterobacter cloacae complex sp. 4DZ3-17B2 TaxID=2511990 RepID=UPI001CA537C9
NCKNNIHLTTFRDVCFIIQFIFWIRDYDLIPFAAQWYRRLPSFLFTTFRSSFNALEAIFKKSVYSGSRGFLVRNEKDNKCNYAKL